MRTKKRISRIAVVLFVVCSTIAVAQVNSLGTFTSYQYTKPAPGFFPDQKLHIMQQMPGTGPGWAAEYCRLAWNKNICFVYMRNPVQSKLLYGGQKVAWPLVDTDLEFKLKFPLWRFGHNPLLGLHPYWEIGGAAIALNGGTTYKQDPRKAGSGLNGQGDILAGIGFDRKLWGDIGMRTDLTIPCLKQSGFSDITYRSDFTCKAQWALGFVHYWGVSKRSRE